MSKVFVIDTNKRPLNPVHPGRARRLLTSGQAAVYRRYPFTIILKKAVEEQTVQPLRVKLDPGSKTTGIAIVNDLSGEVVFAAELGHRGHKVKKALVVVHAKGAFDITTKAGRTVEGIGHRYCTALHRCDGYSYGDGKPAPSLKKGTLVSSPCLQEQGSLQAEFGWTE